jgi:2-polyprenyl-3-methyl-5-hydroxy-6-metoxy-1,4-benzoquinol methylase
MNLQSYNDYIYNQTVKYLSHEDDQSVWSQGQLRFLDSILHLIPNNSKILDVGCGDGVSLVKLNNLGHNAIGVDLSEEKLDVATRKGCIAHKADMHDLSLFADEEFNTIISSHSLEHAYDPGLVLDQLNRVLSKTGYLFIVLPYPDVADYAIEAHVGRGMLGTSDPADGPIKLTKFVNDHGFSISTIKYDNYREPEIWLFCRKNK